MYCLLKCDTGCIVLRTLYSDCLFPIVSSWNRSVQFFINSVLELEFRKWAILELLIYKKMELELIVKFATKNRTHYDLVIMKTVFSTETEMLNLV